MEKVIGKDVDVNNPGVESRRDSNKENSSRAKILEPLSEKRLKSVRRHDMDTEESIVATRRSKRLKGHSVLIHDSDPDEKCQIREEESQVIAVCSIKYSVLNVS